MESCLPVHAHVSLSAPTPPQTCDPLILNSACETLSLRFLPHRSTDSRHIHHSLPYINLIETEKNNHHPHIKLSWGSLAGC